LVEGRSTTEGLEALDHGLQVLVDAVRGIFRFDRGCAELCDPRGIARKSRDCSDNILREAGKVDHRLAALDADRGPFVLDLTRMTRGARQPSDRDSAGR